MSPLFAVPEDDIRSERINLPNGRYQADFTGAEIVGNEADWRAIKPRFENLSTPTGETQVMTMWKGREVTVDLVSRVQTTVYTAESSNEQAKEIGARDIARLAVALGIAVNGDGMVTVPGETIEEVVAALNKRAGTRLNLSIRNKVRKRAKVVVTDERGEPRVDDEIGRVWAIGG